MALTLDDLIARPQVLKPAEVEISGLDEKLLIHVFTMDQVSELIESIEDEDPEQKLRKQVVMFLRGVDARPSAEDCAALSKIFTGFQLREIYTKAFRLNGFGPDALREAEKN